MHALTLLLVSGALLGADGPVDPGSSAKELIGLWQAHRNFGPALRGTLTLTRQNGRWHAEIAGQSADAGSQGDQLQAAFPGDQGEFQGALDPKAGQIRGHWIQARTVTTGSRFASPVTLKPAGRDRWRGDVVPLDEKFTLYLVATAREDGSVGAFLRNPDRNLGVFLNVDHLERAGDTVRLVGSWRNNKPLKVLAEGTYHAGETRADDRLSVYLADRGGSFDFARVEPEAPSGFFARGSQPGPYQYFPPPAEDDGWATGSLEQVGLSVDPIKKMIEEVLEAPIRSVHDPDVHGLLIARHGKLVLEEYFHGFHRDQPHDTRSAAKSLTATLVGAALAHGAPFDASSSVYSLIYGKRLPADLDPRKKQMTVEHLLTMRSGFFCDDNNSDAPGNEDVMQEQTQDLDWYHYTLNLPMASAPGQEPIYCSVNPNLLGAVLKHTTGRPLAELFRERIAEPLQIRRYHLFLSPTKDAYLAGGARFLPRDFMKLGQLMLDGGSWKGRRILSSEWARRATSPLEKFGKIEYGYLWWNTELPFRGRTIRAFFAGGNGGQVVMGIPELDMVVAFYAGNYSDRVMFRIQEEFVPQYILPAVREDHPPAASARR